MSFAYLASMVRVMYEDEEWWSANGPTEDNNFTFVNGLEEAIDITDKALTSRKHKHLIPKDKTLLSYIKRIQAKEKEERRSPYQPSTLVKLQAVLGEAYGKTQLSNLIKLCEQRQQQVDYDHLACLNQKGDESHQWLLVTPSDQSLRMNNQVVKHAVRYRLGLNPYDTIVPSTCLCGKKDIYSTDPYHSLSCPALRHHGTNIRHETLVRNMSTWIERTGALVRTEVTGLSKDDRKRPDIVFWFEQRQHVIDVTVTDPFNSTNNKRIHPASSSSAAAAMWGSRVNSKSMRFDSRAAQYELLHSVVEKRKNKHYKELLENMRAIYSDSTVHFHTAGAFTTGGLCGEFRELIKVVSIMAQRERGGWDPVEVMEGLKGCVAVAIQQGNAMVLNDSWNRIAQRNYNRLLRPEKQEKTAWRRRVHGRGREIREMTAANNQLDSTSCTLVVPSVA
jgi:hypothetical protein